MGFCKKNNLTIIFRSLRAGNYCFINNQGQLDGVFCGKINEYIDNLNKGCKVVESFEIGKELKNGSFDGALGKLQRRIGDLYFEPFPLDTSFKRDFFKLTHPSQMEKKSFFQIIKLNNHSNDDLLFKHLLSFSELFTKLLYSVFLTYFILLILPILLNRKKSIKLKFLIVLKYFLNQIDFRNDYRYRFTIIGLMMIFSKIFFMNISQILSSLIKTSKVLIDTNELIKSLNQLIDSKLIVCFTDTFFIKKPNEINNNSLMSKLYRKTYFDSEGKRKCIFAFSEFNSSFNATNKAILTNKRYVEPLLSFYSLGKKELKYFLSEPLLENVQIQYFSSFLDKISENSINKLMMTFLEAALIEHLQDFVMSKFLISERFEIYYSINDYIDRNTLYEFNSDQFNYFFYLLLKLELCFFVLFISNLLIIFLNKYFLIIKNKIKILFLSIFNQLFKLYLILNFLLISLIGFLNDLE